MHIVSNIRPIQVLMLPENRVLMKRMGTLRAKKETDVSHGVTYREFAIGKPPLAPHACDATSPNADERM
jgi:hypothetical protein